MPRSRKPASTSLKPSDLFEQRIHRIHELLEGFDAEVTWDDRVIDPDQPSRRRQIDISVKRDNRLTLIECRLHRVPQHVKWIEELIGRRQSLGAHAVIAVSSSGFTRGAIAKAIHHNVLTRDLRELSDEEVREWGRAVTLTLYFFAYSDMVLTLTFSTESLMRIDATQLHDELARHPILTSMFNAAAKLVGQKLIPAVADQNLTANFGFRLDLGSFTLVLGAGIELPRPCGPGISSRIGHAIRADHNATYPRVLRAPSGFLPGRLSRNCPAPTSGSDPLVDWLPTGRPKANELSAGQILRDLRQTEVLLHG